jgi:hypothetical protein
MFDTKSIIQLVQEKLDQEFSSELTEALTKLYLAERRYGSSLNVYTNLRKSMLRSVEMAEELEKRTGRI